MRMTHGTALVYRGAGILLRGPSGCGKSDLALRLIDDGATLVGDDYLSLSVEAGRVVAAVPDRLAGLLEVRGMGIVRLDHQPRASLDLLVDLIPGCQQPRLPEPALEKLEGVALPRLAIDPVMASALARLRLAIRLLVTGEAGYDVV